MESEIKAEGEGEAKDTKQRKRETKSGQAVWLTGESKSVGRSVGHRQKQDQGKPCGRKINLVSEREEQSHPGNLGI